MFAHPLLLVSPVSVEWRSPCRCCSESDISFSLLEVREHGELAQTEIKETLEIGRKEVKMSSKPCHPIVGGVH